MNQITFDRIFKRLERIPHEKFVIHGSARKSSILIPKKPRPLGVFRDKKAVYATLAIDVALIHAVMRGNFEYKYVKGKGVVITIKDNEVILEPGYIHVCDRRDFKGRVIFLYSDKPVRPVEVIKVYPEMFIDSEKNGSITFS